MLQMMHLTVMRQVGDGMRYDQTAYLIKNVTTESDPDSLNFEPQTTVTKVKANIKRTNLTLANGEMYDATIVRVFGEYDADSIGLADYDSEDDSTVHKIQKVGRHFNRTDFYIVNSEVIFNAKQR